MAVELGPYPLCEQCKKTNGGLVAVRHRQVHVRARGQESCVDQGLARLITNLWEVCRTRSCCEDLDGRAFVVTSSETIDAAEQRLTELGLPVEREQGVLTFRVPPPQPVPPVEPGLDIQDSDPPLLILGRVVDVIAAAASRLDAALPGVEHVRIVEAKRALRSTREAVTRAMYLLVSVLFHRHRGQRPAGVVLLLLLFVAAIWPVTWVAAVLTDESVSWMFVTAFCTAVATARPIARLVTAVDRWLGRARVARRGLVSGPASVPEATDGSTLLRPLESELAQIRVAIDSARGAVGSVAWRYLGARRRRLARFSYGLVWTRDWDLVVANLARADLMLRMASDAIVQWQSSARG